MPTKGKAKKKVKRARRTASEGAYQRATYDPKKTGKKMKKGGWRFISLAKQTRKIRRNKKNGQVRIVKTTGG